MSVFGAYSRYYNLFYQDKDYPGEAEYVNGLIGKHHPGAKSILDLGCGTGRHDLLLADLGYDVTGVDRSEEMLAVANSHLSSLISQRGFAHPSSLISHPPLISFHQGDIRSIRLNRTFDVVISLFHVVSYLTTNEDLAAAFATARVHLKPGGICIFDCWYGPAVLTDRPVVRVKRLEDEEIAVTRIVEPVMYPDENLVELKYHIFARMKQSGSVEEIRESHRMRYLFRPEMELLLRKTGMSIIDSSEWMTGRKPGFDTWGVCFVVKNQMSDER
jgi:SAM-dependent methyltransferase